MKKVRLQLLEHRSRLWAVSKITTKIYARERGQDLRPVSWSAGPSLPFNSRTDESSLIRHNQGVGEGPGSWR